MTAPSFDRVVDALDSLGCLPHIDGRQNGRLHMLVRCPAHDDRSPSLSVTHKVNRTLVRCFAGCEAEDVVDALGLEWSDLFDEPYKGSEFHSATKGVVPDESNSGDASWLLDFEQIVARPVRWAWQHRIALAKLTALAGRPKIGKGLLYTDLTARVTRGTLEGDLSGPRNVILVTTEDDPGDTLKPRLMAAGADLSRVSVFQMGTRDDPVPFRVPQDAAELGRRVAEKEASLVVVDPLMEFIDGKVASRRTRSARR
jgi:hypothetical protein